MCCEPLLHLAQRLLGVLFNASVFVLLFSCGQATNAELMAEEGLILTMSIDSTAQEQGKVILTSTLVNDLEYPVELLPWNTPFDISVNGNFLSVVDKATDEKLSYLGRLIKRLPPNQSDYLRLNPGEGMSNDLDISNSYHFCANGRYVLSVSGSLYDRDSKVLPLKTKSVEMALGNAFKAC